MPQLGESVTEGTISKWLVAVGDHVNKYDPIADVMTDKVNAEIPSSFTGIIKEIVAQEGETLAVGEVICKMEVEGTAQTEIEKTMDVVDSVEKEQKQENSSSKKMRYSPAVLKLSQEHGIDLSLVEGTGMGGRITRKDLLKIIDSGQIPQQQPKTADTALKIDNKVNSSISSQPAVVPSVKGDIEVPVTGVRRAIATNMLRSKHEIPHAWTMVEVDVTNLVSLRESQKQLFKEKEGFSLTYFAFFVKAIAQGLKEFPQMNAMWAGDKIIQKKEINLSIAVATEDALFVPVIKHADEKSIKGIAREITELAQKVRTGTLTSAEMQGGTFTVNNTGSFGSVQSMGIINYPQAAILQVESIVKRPVVRNDGIAVRDMVNLCLSLDHRVLDGLICGRFLQRVKEILENMSTENTSIY